MRSIWKACQYFACEKLLRFIRTGEMVQKGADATCRGPRPQEPHSSVAAFRDRRLLRSPDASESRRKNFTIRRTRSTTPTSASRHLACHRMRTRAAPRCGRTDGLFSSSPQSRCSTSGAAGNVNSKLAPWGAFTVAHNRPPCASMMDREIDRPIPRPPGFVV